MGAKRSVASSRQRWLTAAAVIALATASSAAAQTTHGSATWSPVPGSGDWNTAGNWVPATVPNGTADTATFGITTTTAVALSQNTTVSRITFDATAANFYTITATPGTTLTISGAGVVNSSGVAQSFVASGSQDSQSSNATGGTIVFRNGAGAGAIAVTEQPGIDNSRSDVNGVAITEGKVSFYDNSTAGSSNILTQGSPSQGIGARLQFFDQSTAGASKITVTGGVGNFEFASGTVAFSDSTSAGTAKIMVGGGGAAGTSGGIISFSNTASAANATITVNGDGLNNSLTDLNEGFVVFGDSSTAASATLIGAGGRIQFFDTSSAASAVIQLTNGGVDFGNNASGGTSRIILNGSATLDISATGGEIISNFAGTGNDLAVPSGSVSVGSIEGAGLVRLGENVLAVGTNNASTVFSGSISEGGREFDDGVVRPASAGNALTKVGTGVLTLSGASTYTGPTTVSAGTLSVTGSLVSPVTVNNGGTLTNNGAIGGLTLAAGGTLASTGTPTTMTVTGAGSFAIGSTLNLDITPGGASDFVSIGGAGSLGGATLNILAAPGTYAPGQSYTLLTANGGLNGTFTYGGITGGTYATQPTLGYTANSVLLDFAALGAPAHGSAIWKAIPTTGDWNTPVNWANNTVPNGSADIATFDKTTIPSVSLSQNTQVDSVVFNPGAGANPYTITAAPGTTLTISGAGVVNNSGVAQNFVTGSAPTSQGVLIFDGNAAVSGPVTITNTANNSIGYQVGQITTPSGTVITVDGGTTVFSGTSNAGSAAIVNAAVIGAPGAFNQVDGGQTIFDGNASAGSATISNRVAVPAANMGNFRSGGTFFYGNSSASSSTINVDGYTSPQFVPGSIFFVPGAYLSFNNNATAANATITVTGDGNVVDEIQDGKDTSSGLISFGDATTAGNAKITANGGEVEFLGYGGVPTAGASTLTANGGNLIFEGTASGGTARIALNGAGTLDLSLLETSSSYDSAGSGTFSNTPATLTIGSIEGSGFVRLGANGLTVGSNNLSTNYSGTITTGGGLSSTRADIVYADSAPFALTKVGTGTLILSGASTYTGATAVNAGTLSITGSLVSPVTVNSGATLTVSGKVGGVTLAQGSTLATLGTPQTMTVTGAANFAAGSTVKLAVTPAGANDQIAVGGAAQLGGATLQVAASPGTQRYTLLIAAGGVSGTFAFAGVSGLGTLSALVTPSLIYSADSVVLAFSRVQIPGGTFNQRAVAGALNADALTAPLLLALTTNGLPGNAQLDQASGEIHATLRSALFEDGALLREATFDRLRGAAAGDNIREGVALWADVRGDRLTLDSDGNAAQARANGQAVVIGADYGLGPWRVGAAYSNNWGRVTVADRNSSAKWTGDSVTAYAGGVAGPLVLKAGASETWYRLDTQRSPDLPGGPTAEGAQYHARLGQVFGEAAIGAGIGGVHGEAFGRWTGEQLTTDAFAESDGATALSGARHRNELSWSLAGLRGSAPLGGSVSFAASAGWAHLFGGETSSDALADSSGTGFLVLGAPLARDGARVSAALSARVGPQMMVRLGYTGDYAGGNTQHALNAAAVVRF